MMRLKVLGLAAAAVGAVMAFAGSASATTDTDSSGSSTPTIHAVNLSTHVTLHNSFLEIQCQSTAKGIVPAATEGGTGVTPSVPLSHLSFTGCTGGWKVDVVTSGSLEFHWWTDYGTHGKGKLTSSGATVTATGFGITCSYRTDNTSLGLMTGGSFGTLHIEAAIPKHHGSFLCGGSSAGWTGSYLTTETLKIDK